MMPFQGKAEVSLESKVILEYGAALETSVAALRSYWMCLDEEISFDQKPFEPSKYDNEYAPENLRCHVFHPIGGVRPWDNAGEWYFNGSHVILGVGLKDESENDRELIAFYTGLSRSACVAINKKLDIGNPRGNPPKEEGAIDLGTPFVGQFEAKANLASIPYLSQRLAGCFEADSTLEEVTLETPYIFYQALAVR